MNAEREQKFAPCPTCEQYSHSIGEDQLAAAFNHFQSMYAHPVRGHPMGDNFDAKTRDAAQVLMAAALSARPEAEALARLVKAGRLALAANRTACAPLGEMDELRKSLEPFAIIAPGRS